MEAWLLAAVRLRAGDRCEYCQMSQEFYPTVTFPVDHIIARQHGGETCLSNLALSCLHCNSYKGPNIAGLDPRTRKLTPLFNTRRHKWQRHFRWDSPLLAGRTPIGRTTVGVLLLNAEEFIAVRQELIAEGVFPPRMVVG